MQTLRVRLLGGFEVEGVESVRLGSRKARRLLKLLALARGGAVSLDVLVAALWPDTLPANPADQVSVLISRLRRVLGTDRIRRVDAGYALAVDWLDVEALGDLVAEAERRLRSGGLAPARSAAGAALALARGPLLPDEIDAAWATADRAEAERRVNRARVLLGEAALVVGDGWEAVNPAQQALQADPYDEGALRLLMSAYAATGRPALALAAYAETAATLAEDLGSDPAPATAALHLEILRGGGRPVAPPRPASPVRPELSGREEELTALDAALADAASGHLGFVVIEGEPGIGKTALLDAWLATTPDTDTVVLRASGSEPGSGLPLDPVLSALAAYVAAMDGAAAHALLGPESELLGPLLGRVDRDHSGVARLALTDMESGPTGRMLLFSALDTVLSRLAAESPVIFAVDDGHLVDPMTAEWLHHCARRLPERRLLLLVARRPDEGPDYSATLRLPLGALSREAAAAVVGEERVDDLYARTEGHPLFLVELSRCPDDELPGSVRMVAAGYCERSGEAAATLRTAAVLGPSVDLDLLANVLDRPPAELLDDLEVGLRRHLLTEHRDGFVFTHRLLRESLEADTSGPRRALLHRRAARALAGRRQPDPLRIAHLARVGGDFPLAVLAELLLARATAAAGYPPPPELVGDSVAALDQVAALEAWHVTAELAREFRVDAWSRLAARRVQVLARRAGP